MFLSALKKGLALFSLSFFYLSITFLESQLVWADSEDLLKKLKSYLIPVKTEKGVKYYLSIRDECGKYKAKATECCINPNQCTGLLTSLAQNAAPVLPALYGAYKAFEVSDEARKGKYSREEAAAKMCDARNEAVMGSYLAGILSQLGTFLQKTCKDKIKKCQAQCNAEIQAFREDFRYYFSIIPRDTVEEITAFAKECNEKANNGPIINDDAINLNAIRSFANNEMECSLEGERDPSFISVSKKDIGYILLFAKAYANSSAIEEGKELIFSEKSDEKQIVDCSKQKDRAVASRNSPTPVSQGVISLCQQMAKQVIENPTPPPPNPVSVPNDPIQTSALTGSSLDKPGKGSPLFMDPNSSYGILPDPEDIDDSLPDSSKRPPLSSGFKSGFSGNSGGPGGSGGSFGGAGASLPGGGSNNSSGEDGLEDSEADPNTNGGSIPASFAGSGDYPSSFGGGGYGDSYSKRPVATLSSKSPNDIDSMSSSGNDEKNLDTKDGKSIFQLASQRIQQFCSDHSCIE